MSFLVSHTVPRTHPCSHTHKHTHTHPTSCYSVCFSVTGCVLWLEVAPLLFIFSLKAEDDYVRILDINSLKRFEYCSGLTVEISAPACKAERRQVRTPSSGGKPNGWGTEDSREQS